MDPYYGQVATSNHTDILLQELLYRIQLIEQEIEHINDDLVNIMSTVAAEGPIFSTTVVGDERNPFEWWRRKSSS